MLQALSLAVVLFLCLLLCARSRGRWRRCPIRLELSNHPEGGSNAVVRLPA